ncbi:hypothetical protein PtA15_2A924 [Puccinia triticina]|uniref:Uncharacterized protein n=1 Tax=Puccinia triticina TaxID=208348 RepID=A0ABY7CF94_9BASI|nr:uncharacterized protein PtA15_2A924 [Puccinia triticina]WAQ82607.1 hypothetical protein PtA15_2A924 [Puccinia triticina]
MTTVGTLPFQQPTHPSQRPPVGFLMNLNNETINPHSSIRTSPPSPVTPTTYELYPTPSQHYSRLAPHHDFALTLNPNGPHAYSLSRGVRPLACRGSLLDKPNQSSQLKNFDTTSQAHTQPALSRGVRPSACRGPLLDKPNQSSHKFQSIEKALTPSAKPSSQLGPNSTPNLLTRLILILC